MKCLDKGVFIFLYHFPAYIFDAFEFKSVFMIELIRLWITLLYAGYCDSLLIFAIIVTTYY